MAVPPIIYGTAWKEEATRSLTAQALKVGFRAIDTANQRKHYVEAAVGEAVEEAVTEGICRREELFLQTKFTFAAGQDHRIPYDVEAPFSQQVEQSVASSLDHLGTDYLDAYLLHGPSRRPGLGEADWEVWRAMEELQRRQVARSIGISNVTAAQLSELLEGASCAPAFVQNRCFARAGWDASVRQICREQGVVYQGFSLLTANRHELSNPKIRDIATRRGVTIPQIVFAFASRIGILPLTGTTDATHMRQDLDALDLTLSDEEIRTIETIAHP